MTNTQLCPQCRNQEPACSGLATELPDGCIGWDVEPCTKCDGYGHIESNADE